jgi:hypothetical protein
MVINHLHSSSDATSLYVTVTSGTLLQGLENRNKCTKILEKLQKLSNFIFFYLAQKNVLKKLKRVIFKSKTFFSKPPKKP